MSRQYPDTAPDQTTAIDFQVVIGPRTDRWDARADAFAMSAYRLGQTVQQITTGLCMNGYAAFTAEVLESLDRQRVQPTPQRAEPAGSTTLRWDARAEEFTLAAHRIGQTPRQVWIGLSRAGYGVTVDDVTASLHRQRIHLA